MSSHTPDGGYVPTFAGNYGLDGFDFDTDYGEGSDTARKDPTTSRTTGLPAPARSENGLAHLPDGFATGAKSAAVDDDVFAGATGTDVGDLSGMVREANHIVDLSWLELAEQDPDRLPHQHNDAVLQGLVEAWGTNRRTDGVNIVPNVVVPPPPRSQVALLPGDHLREVVASAMRKSAYGQAFPNILADVVAHLGESLNHVHTDPRLQRFAAAIRSVRAEHGVVGRVYLRDSAFPGLLTGKWDKEVKHRCGSAHYWLTKPGSKLAAYSNYLGKQVVTEVPWGQALDYYRPTLEASGKRLASGDPKTVLVAAIRQDAVKAAREVHHTYHQPPSDRVTIQEAWKVFASAPMPKREIIEKNTVRLSMKQAEQKVGQWVRDGLLPQESARKLLACDLTPEDKLRAGAVLIAHTSNRTTYEGTGVGVKTLVRATRDAGTTATEQSKLASDLEARQKHGTERKVIAKFAQWVRNGLLTQKQAQELVARDAPALDRVRAGAVLAMSSSKKAQYQGAGVGVRVHTDLEHGRTAVEVRPVLKYASLLRYALVQMNEGVTGNDLDTMLASRFSQDYLKAADEPLVQIRRKHEGLAGHAYVAADAYASPTGTTGCDKGALIHRANQLKAVLQMDRCGSCSQNSEGSCQKYGKKLVTAAPVADADKYQREMIRLANADDSERTAAMFNNYDSGEFELQNDSLDSFDYSNLPDNTTLHNILFEGMILPED